MAKKVLILDEKDLGEVRLINNTLQRMSNVVRGLDNTPVKDVLAQSIQSIEDKLKALCLS